MTPRPPARPLGLPVPVILLLAALPAVRGVLHDVGLTPPGTLLTAALVFVPLLVWVVVAVARSSRPLVSLLAAGAGYGILLSIVHIALWDVNLAASGTAPPRLGGALEGLLPPLVEAVLMRGAAAISSILVGLAAGLVTGLIALAARRILDARRRAVAS